MTVAKQDEERFRVVRLPKPLLTMSAWRAESMSQRLQFSVLVVKLILPTSRMPMPNITRNDSERSVGQRSPPYG